MKREPPTEYNLTPEQEQMLRAYLRSSIMPLLERVLVKKLGQAMLFAKEELQKSSTLPQP